MTPRTREFLDSYLAVLRSVHTAAHARERLPKWQFESYPELRAVLPNLNRSLGLSGDGAFLNHIATSVVGDLSGFAVMSANPGWDARRNPREHSGRIASASENHRLVNEFFSAYPEMAKGTSGWWTKVLKMHDRTRLSGEEGLRGRALWRLAREWHVGGVDLVPFHSRRDHVTPLLLNPTSEASQMLRSIALETLGMTLRVGPRVLLVASRTGAVLVKSLAQGMPQIFQGSESLPPSCTDLWQTVEVYQTKPAGTMVVVFPGQIFSGSYRIPKEHTADGLDRIVRDLLVTPLKKRPFSGGASLHR